MSSRRLVPAALLSAGLLTLLTLTACEQSGDSSSDEPSAPSTAPASDSESSAVEPAPVETAVAAAAKPIDAPDGTKREPAPRIAPTALARDRAADADDGPAVTRRPVCVAHRQHDMAALQPVGVAPFHDR